MRNKIISASGLYIEKEKYGGRYLKWCETEVPQSEWPYYLRNYLLRHLLEFHYTVFDEFNDLSEPIDLVLDRVLLKEIQVKNTLDYLNSRIAIPLREEFKIPPIVHLTIADSHYVGGLEIAHLLAEVLRETAKGTLTPNIKGVSDFMRIEKFLGRRKDDLQ